MNLVRTAARPMLSAIFVSSGIQSLRDPGKTAPAAAPVAEKIVPLAKKVAPARMASKIPTDAETLVKINAAVQTLGGLALATNNFRRVGATALAASLVPTTLAAHRFWEHDDPAAKAENRLHFLKNVGLMGGLLLASQDTEGNPSLIWRASQGAQLAKKETGRAARLAKREAKHQAKEAQLSAKLAAKQLPGV